MKQHDNWTVVLYLCLRFETFKQTVTLIRKQLNVWSKYNKLSKLQKELRMQTIKFKYGCPNTSIKFDLEYLKIKGVQ